MNPDTSVVMSVYNGEKYLGQAINSILNQTYSNFEFIIINDGSTDRTKEILESYTDSRIKIIHQKNMGLIGSLNRGLSLSKGKYIARQDADDAAFEHRFEEQIRFLENSPETVLVGSSCSQINEEGEEIGIVHYPTTDTEIRWKLLFKNPFWHPTIMIRADILRREGLQYDDRALYVEDYDLWSRTTQYGKCANIKMPLIQYRIHSKQITRQYREEQEARSRFVSRQNIKRLGIEITDDEMKKLRIFEELFPSSMNRDENHLFRLYLSILKAFRRQQKIDMVIYEVIKSDCINKICNRINAKNIKDVIYSGLLFDLFTEEYYFLLGNFSRRIINKVLMRYVKSH
jgi:glycosyltransferase involved in cell wall biosynthesis